jgi:SAM-dependent methyltransferase
MAILETERALYADLWASLPAYAEHAPGTRYLPVLLDAAGDRRGTVLDAGTGSGKGALAVAAAGFDVTLCDVTDAGLVDEAQGFPFVNACLWHPLPGRYDWVYCTDVLEHVPPQFTMLAISQMLAVAREALVLSVSCVPDGFGVWAGRALHQTVQPFVWWRDSLREIGTITEARDLLSDACFVVRPR